MSEPFWERLPEDTQEVCNRSKLGWSEADADRCGNKAQWIERKPPGYDGIQMNLRHCGSHHEAYLSEQRRTEEWGKRNVVTESLPGGIYRARRRNDQKEN